MPFTVLNLRTTTSLKTALYRDPPSPVVGKTGLGFKVKEQEDSFNGAVGLKLLYGLVCVMEEYE